MRIQLRMRNGVVSAGLAMVLAGGGFAMAQQTPPRRPAPPHAAAPAEPAAPVDEANASELQDQLMQLLRTSPTLTMVVARDPSLLSDQEYVERNNPDLAKFLAAHPEVARDPTYYLFSQLTDRRGGRSEALERAVWPDVVGGVDATRAPGSAFLTRTSGPGLSAWR